MNDASKPVWFILFVVVSLATVVVIARSRSLSDGKGDGQGAVSWQTDLATAREQSARDGKPILLYFTADWCPPCKKMKSNTWVDSKVAGVIQDRYIPVMVNTDQQQELSREYGVSGIPRVEVLSATGDRRLVTEGYLSPEEMIAALR